MALFKSGNPTLSEKQFEKTINVQTGETMTVNGTLNKFSFLMLMVMAGAFITWNQFSNGANPMPLMLGGAIGGFIVALIIVFKKSWSPILAPAYAILEGLFIGGLSAVINHWVGAEQSPPGETNLYSNIVFLASVLTFAVALSMYLLYTFRIIKVTDKLRSIIVIATASIAVFYLIRFVMSLFGVSMTFFDGGDFMGIGFSLVVIIVAALNLLLDFDMIEQGSQMGAPKYMEWYGAFGLLVTIVWLYIEILRLLAKLSSRD